MREENIQTLVINSITPKAAAKHELLFNKPTSDVDMLNNCVKL
jgi:hypothetical protein